VNAVAINSAGYIFAGVAAGIFRSTSDGDSWIDISGGVIPPGGNVWALAIGSGGYTFAGTALGGGVLRSARSTTDALALRLIRAMNDRLLIIAAATRSYASSKSSMSCQRCV